MAATVTPLGTPGTLQTVTIASGVPTAGSGTVSTLDNVFNVTNGPVDIKAASTAAATTDKALVVAISPNGQNQNGQAAATASTPVVLALDQFPIHANLVSGVITTAMTGTTATQLLAAPAAGLRNFITQITASNSHATQGTDVLILDGSTPIYLVPAASLWGGATLSFPTPLRQPTTATVINAQNVTTGAAVKVAACGYKAA